MIFFPNMWKFCHMHNVPSSNLWFLRLPTRLVRSLTRYSPATNGCGCSQWFHNMFPWNSESMSPCITALEVSAFCDLIIAKSSRIGRGGTMGLWWILALGKLVLSSTLLTPLWRVQSSPRFGLENKIWLIWQSERKVLQMFGAQGSWKLRSTWGLLALTTPS